MQTQNSKINLDMSDIKKIKTALVSVYHKDGLDEIISLPLYPSMTQEEVCYVADAVCEIANQYSK